MSDDFTVDHIGGMCPTQAEGRFANGQPYYFRARSGVWRLKVGPVGEPVDFPWSETELIADGADGTHGCMDDTAVLAIIRQHARPAAAN